MPDPTSESTRMNYAQQDASARRLWDTQRGKANPWEHRGRNLDGEDSPQTDVPSPEAPAAEAAPTAMIAQQDRLRLHKPAKDVENPFESLIEHQLHLKLPDQP